MRLLPTVIASITLTALVLAGCGGDDDTAGEHATSAATSASTSSDAASASSAPSTPAVAETTMLEACPAIEAALPESMVPSVKRLQLYANTIATIDATADLETANALKLLVPALEQQLSVVESGAKGLPFLRAQKAYIESLDSFAARCAAAGSSALQ